MTPQTIVDISERCRRYREWVGNRRSYRPEEVPPEARVSNKERSELEVYRFIHEPPDELFCYPSADNKTATTWMGDNLGKLTLKKKWRSNLGDTRQTVEITGINGVTYKGTLHGTYIRAKRVA